MSSIVMSGAIGEFDVPSILQAVSLSRQCTLLRLWDRNKHETGEIRIKAGQLLDAICGQERGRAALHTLLRGKHHTFRVERFGDPVNAPEPVGSLAALLMEVPQPVSQTPSAPAAPVRLAPPAPETLAGHPPDAVAHNLEGLAALDQVLVMRGRGQGWEWTRDTTRIPKGALRKLAMLVQSGHPEGLPHWSTFETSTATVVVRGAEGAELIAYGFPPSTPLGLMRMVVSAAERVATGASAEGLH